MRKKITLEETASERLKTWKRSPLESFSDVIKRVIPKQETLGGFINYQWAYAVGEAHTDDLMEITVGEKPLSKIDPWH